MSFIISLCKWVIILFLITIIVITFGYATEWYWVSFVNNLIHGSTANDIVKSSTLTFLCTLIAGTGGLLLLILNFKKYNQTQEQIYKSEKQHQDNLERTQKQINLTEENNLNTTFKDAVTLLGNDNVSVRMGGVYTLIDIAKKTADTNNSYVERINNILCQHISDRSNIEYYEYFKNNGIKKKDAQIFEQIDRIKEIYNYIYYNTNIQKLMYETTKIKTFWAYFLTDNKDKTNEYLKEISKKKDNYLRILDLLSSYSSSNEVKQILNLLLNNANIFRKLIFNNIKISNIDFINYDCSNIEINNSYLGLIDISLFYNQGSFNLKINESFLNNNNISISNSKSVIDTNNSILFETKLVILKDNHNRYNSSKSYLIGSQIIIKEKFKTNMMSISDNNINYCYFDIPLVVDFYYYNETNSIYYNLLSLNKKKLSPEAEGRYHFSDISLFLLNYQTYKEQNF